MNNVEMKTDSGWWYLSEKKIVARHRHYSIHDILI